MASEKQQPERSRSLAQKVAGIALGIVLGVAGGLFLAWVVLCLVILVYEGWHHRKGPWRGSVHDISRLVTLVEIVKAVQQVDGDSDGRSEYVGWRNYIESVRSASPETVDSIEHELSDKVAFTDISLEAFRTRFILEQEAATVGEYEVQTGRYVDGTVFPHFDLALFTPTDPDRAERIWILVARTDEKACFQTLESFLIVKNEREVDFYFGRNFPMDSDRGLPDIERLGRFVSGAQGEVWQPYPLPD